MEQNEQRSYMHGTVKVAPVPFIYVVLLLHTVCVNHNSGPNPNLGDYFRGPSVFCT